jgi:hypothetical protein
MSALASAEELERERLHREELGIAGLTSLLYNIKRDPDKSEALSADSFCHFKPVNPDIPPATVCDAYFSLCRDFKIPAWAVSLAPIQQLRAGQRNGNVPMPRALIGEGVVILLPKLKGGKIHTPYAMVDEGATGRVVVSDVDYPENQFTVLVPAKWELSLITDDVFELAN